MQENVFQRIARLLVRNLFLPAQFDYAKLFSWVSFSLVILFSLFLICISFPPLTAYIINNVLPAERISEIANSTEAVKSWLAFISLALEMTIAVLIGGAVYAGRITSALKDTVTKYQDARERLLGEHRETLEEQTETTIGQISETLRDTNWKTFLPNVCRLAGLTWNLKNLVFQDIPNFYKHYLIVTFYANFPGGLWGLIAFVLFLVVSALKVCGIYVDAIPVA